jgi:FKBP-type peptidyl-prolyl cis-trans isomerase FklB
MRTIISCSLVLLAVATKALNKPATSKTTTTTKKPAVIQTAAPAFKNQLDSFSYAIGLSIANFYKEQGINDINTAMVMKALSDSKSGKTAFDANQANTCIMGYMQKVRSGKSAGTKKACEAFLAENKKRPGVITTASGLQYEVIKEGNGEKPKPGEKVKVHYHGTLIDGSIFDSSVDRGEPIEFPVTGVIPGWVEALQLMPVGSKWKLYIPSDLAYGDNDMGPMIKAGSALIFEVELLGIVK